MPATTEHWRVLLTFSASVGKPPSLLTTATQFVVSVCPHRLSMDSRCLSAPGWGGELSIAQRAGERRGITTPLRRLSDGAPRHPSGDSTAMLRL